MTITDPITSLHPITDGVDDAEGAPHWTGAPSSSRWVRDARALAPVLATRAAAHDRDGTFVHEAIDELRACGFLSMLVPTELGGGGATHRDACAVLAELARGCASTSLVLSMHQHLVAAQVWRHHRGLPAPVLAKVGAQQVMLVSTGASDWIGSNGRATRVDGGYRITARKAPASGAPAGTVLVTSARWDDAPEGPQVIHCAVPFAAAGVRVEPTWDTIGMRGTGSDTVVLDDVFVPDDAVSLVRPAGAWHPVWAIVAGAALPLIMATYAGLADAAAERAIVLARDTPARAGVVERIGRMLNQRTIVRDAVCAMLHDSADLRFDNTVELASRMFARKTIAAEAAIATVRLALDAGGGRAYSRDGGLDRLHRDVQAANHHLLAAAEQEQFCGRLALGLDPVAG